MSEPGKLSLPNEFPYLGRKSLTYRLVEQTEAIVTIARAKGQIVHIPTRLVIGCHEHLKSAPDQTLPLQQIIKDTSDSIRVGESIIGATLVAAGLAEVVCYRPIRLKAVGRDFMSDEWPLPEGFNVYYLPTQRGKRVSAEELEQILLKRLKEHEDALENAIWDLARFYSDTGRQTVALSYLERLIAGTDDPTRLAACYLAMGQLMEQIQDFESAVLFYSRAFSLEPAHNQTWYLTNNNLGYCLNLEGRFKEAEVHCHAAIAIGPDRHNAYKNLGVSLEGQGQFAEAARCFISAARANASDPRALRYLEDLIAQHDEVSLEIPDLPEQLQRCRKAVRFAERLGQRGRDKKDEGV